MYSKDEAKQLMTDFWNGFSKYSQFFSVQIGQPIEWMLYKTGIKGLELKFDLDCDGVRSVIESNSRDENRRLEIFVDLLKYRPILESDLPAELHWTDDHVLDVGKPVMRAYCELTGVNFHNRDNWPKLYKFMAETMWGIQTNFCDILPIFEEKYKYC